MKMVTPSGQHHPVVHSTWVSTYEPQVYHLAELSHTAMVGLGIVLIIIAILITLAVVHTRRSEDERG